MSIAPIVPTDAGASFWGRTVFSGVDLTMTAAVPDEFARQHEVLCLAPHDVTRALVHAERILVRDAPARDLDAQALAAYYCEPAR